MIYFYTEQTGWAAGDGVEPSTMAVEETCERQPSLLAAIAHELTKIHLATPGEHWRAARRLLEDAFRVVEETAVDGTSAGGRPVGRARTCRAELAHAC